MPLNRKRYVYIPISMSFGAKTCLGVFSTKKRAQLSATSYEQSIIEIVGSPINPVNILKIEIDNMEGYF